MNERERPSGFNSYHQLLGIPPAEQPPNHYRLLGISPFEQDPDVISRAADGRMGHLRTFQTGKHSAESQTLLNELAAARIELLNPQKKAAYDQQLQLQNTPPPPPPPVVQGHESTPMIVTTPEPVKRGVDRRTKVIAGITAASAVAILGVLAIAYSMSGKKGDTGKLGVEKNPPTPVVKTLTPEDEAGMTMHQPIVKPVDPIEPSSVDPEVERLKEEEKRLRKAEADRLAAEKAEAERVQKFEEAVQKQIAKLQDQYEDIIASQVNAFAQTETDAVKKEAIMRIAKEKHVKTTASTQFKKDVITTSNVEREKYSKSSTEKLLAIAKDKSDPIKITSFCMLALERAAKEGDIENVNTALAMMDSKHLDAHDLLKLKQYHLGSKHTPRTHVRSMSPEQRVVIAQDLHAEIWKAVQEGDFALAEELRMTAHTHYLDGLKLKDFHGETIHIPTQYSANNFQSNTTLHTSVKNFLK